MARPMLNRPVLDDLTLGLARRWPLLLGLAAALMAAGLYAAPASLALPALASGATLASVAGIGQVGRLLRKGASPSGPCDLSGLLEADPTPSLLSTPDGKVSFLNEAARRRFRVDEAVGLARALGDVFANPSGLLFRLQERAEAIGAARDDVVTRRATCASPC